MNTENPKVMTAREKRVKRQLEILLKKRRYRRDDRPDHREWDKYNSAFNTQIRLDQNNPEGFNGFSLKLTAYMRWNISAGTLRRCLFSLKRSFYEVAPRAQVA